MVTSFSSKNVKTIEACVVANFEVASSSSFPDFLQTDNFEMVKSHDGSGGRNAICSRSEVADDVISC